MIIFGVFLIFLACSCLCAEVDKAKFLHVNVISSFQLVEHWLSDYIYTKSMSESEVNFLIMQCNKEQSAVSHIYAHRFLI